MKVMGVLVEGVGIVWGDPHGHVFKGEESGLINFGMSCHQIHINYTRYVA